jgi:N-acetylneuraminic acid mutarotase
MRDRYRGSTLLIAIGASLSLVLAIALALKVFAGIGPELPGPHVRELVGVVDPFAPCTPDPANVRRPSQPVMTSMQWRAGRPAVPALANEEVKAVAIGDRIYVGTGVRANKGGSFFRSLKSLYVFDPATGTYRRAPDLPQALDHTALATWNGNLYLFGGFTDSRPTPNAWRYSPRTRHWTKLAPMRVSRGGLAGAVIGDRYYAVGGVLQQTQRNPLIYGTLEIYDFRTNRWSRGPAMPTPRHHVAAVALGGELYAVGGRGDRDLSLATLERFDPATRRWERLPPLPFGVGDPGAVVARGRLVVLSGGDDAEKWVTPATWSFDPRTARWSRLSDMILARHGFATAVAGGRIYVFGGAPCARYGRTGATESLDLRAVGPS